VSQHFRRRVLVEACRAAGSAVDKVASFEGMKRLDALTCNLCGEVFPTKGDSSGHNWSQSNF